MFPFRFLALALLCLASCGESVTGSNADGSAGAGDSAVPPDLLPPPDLTPEKIPIEHVIVVVKENHTFDNYFGTFPGAEGTTMCHLKNQTILCPHATDR